MSFSTCQAFIFLLLFVPMADDDVLLLLLAFFRSKREARGFGGIGDDSGGWKSLVKPGVVEGGDERPIENSLPFLF